MLRMGFGLSIIRAFEEKKELEHVKSKLVLSASTMTV